MYDTVIRGGLCPDYDAGELKKKDVAVKDGKIADVLEPGTDARAERIIDASGRIVSPGIIDMHMHEEEFRDGSHERDISELMIRQGVTTGVCGNCGIHFHRISDFRRILDENGGSPINYVALAGYNTFREEKISGWYDEASPEVRKYVIEQLRKELEDGAWGFSFGLEYCPGISTEEMTEAVMALKEYDPFISIHFREDCDKCMDSVIEMAELSRNTGCRVEISHIGSLAAVGKHMQESLDYLRKEMSDNPRLRYDVYPYNVFCTIIGSAAFDMDWRAKWGVDYDIIVPLGEPYAGQKCDKDLYEKILREDPDALVAAFALDEDDVKLAMAEPRGLFGSDGQVTPGYDIHPRAAATYPRILGKYVRDEKVLPMILALDKMTRQAAGQLGLENKGEIKKDMDADILIFDPETISDHADFNDTHAPNTGIDYVMVAGTVVNDHDTLTGALPGRFISR